MADSSALYLIGVFAALLGFFALNRWIVGLTGRRRPVAGSVLGAAFALFVAGGLILATAILLDTEQYQIENTRLFVYEVTFRPTGDLPVGVRIPAPLDSRVRTAFPQTNGTSTLSLLGTGTEAYVQAYLTGDASFRVQVQLVGTPLNRSLSATSPARPADSGNTTVAATLEVSDAGPAVSSVDVELRLLYDEFCAEAAFSLQVIALEGRAVYPARWVVSDVVC